jgi:2-keto-4-pentenoate hydratase/2-oxohepta-3-ene-1,7-dioic acid hydratase in catechol pathway
MRWARFDQNGTATYAVVEGDELISVCGSPFTTWERTSARLRLAEATLLPPVIPPTFYACGMNYAGHVKAVAAKIGQAPNLPTQPDIGYRANNALIGPGAPIVIPRDATEKVQYEGELVVVIGRTSKHLTREDALSAVLGYTIGNDVSERSWQKSDRTMWRAKNTDTFKPMGPWIETELRLDDLRTRIRLNGKQLIEFRTNDMVFGVVDYLVAMTRYLTLYPGDMIWMGTEGETADMKHGDVCEVEITGIGTLRNPVVREGAGSPRTTNG